MMWTFSADAAAGQLFMAGPLLIAIAFLVGMGFVAVFYGWLRRGRRPAPPIRSAEHLPREGAWQTPDEFYGKQVPTDHGPGHQDSEPVEYEEASQEPEEVPRDGRRRMPYEIADYPGPRTS